MQERNQIQEDVVNGREIYQNTDGEQHIGVLVMMQEFVNGDVEIINILDYNGMGNVFVLIHLVDTFSIMTKDIRKIWAEKKGTYGEGNHFQEGLRLDLF